MEQTAQKKKSVARKPFVKRLSKKERGFINDYVETGNGVRSALKNYDTDDYKTASAIASENLTKPRILSELAILGFDTNNAKRVVGEILNGKDEQSKDRLKAAEIVLKTQGEMQTEEKGNTTYNIIFSAPVREKVRVIEAELKELLTKPKDA